MISASTLRFGINVHPNEDPAKVIACMKATGFTRYRCDAAVPSFLDAMSAAGMVGNLIVSGGPQATGGQLDLIRTLATAHPGSVGAIEGPNEVNNHQTVYGGFKDTTGFDQSNRSAVHLYMRDLLANVRADAVLSSIPVISHTDLHATWAPSDRINAHAYDGSTDSYPDYWPGQVSREMTAAMPGAPQCLTEFGVQHADRQARLIPQWVAAALQAGLNDLYLYALLDDSESYGIFDANYAPKPGQPAVAQLAKLLTDKLGGGAKPLGVKVSDPGVNSVLVGRSDGSYVHLLWRSWPDGKVHPFSWSYDRDAHIQAHMLAFNGGVWSWPNLTWTKPAGQNSDWGSYTDGVVMLEVGA